MSGSGYEILPDDAVNALHRRYQARLEKKAESAMGQAGASPDLKGLALDLLRHGAKMRLLDMATERLVDVLKNAANEKDTDALATSEKIYLTGQAEQREQRKSSYSAAEVKSNSMESFNRAARKRVFPPAVDAVFDGKQRIYLAIKESGVSPVQQHIAERLSPYGYQITDWSGGYATDYTGKQKFRIGALLRKHIPELLPSFETRTTDNLMVVISRDIRDIAYASTNRAWDSCLGPRGMMSGWRQMGSGIQAGMMVAYLVSDSDPDIHNPLARVMIKPFVAGAGVSISAELRLVFDRIAGRAQGNRIWNADKTYGIPNEAFRKTVQDFIEDKFNGNAKGMFHMADGVYIDTVWQLERRNGTTTVTKNSWSY